MFCSKCWLQSTVSSDVKWQVHNKIYLEWTLIFTMMNCWWYSVLAKWNHWWKTPRLLRHPFKMFPCTCPCKCPLTEVHLCVRTAFAWSSSGLERGVSLHWNAETGKALESGKFDQSCFINNKKLTLYIALATLRLPFSGWIFNYAFLFVSFWFYWCMV